MGSWIDLDRSRAKAWLARPTAGAEGPGVLLLHAWWGLNETIRQFADRLADEGFIVLAPDMFGGVVVDTGEAAEREVSQRDAAWKETLAIVRDGAERVLGDRGEIGRGIGVVGFSFGAAYAIELAAEPPPDLAIDAVVLCYGTGWEHDWSSSAAAFQGHYAENDQFESAESVDGLEASLRAGGRTVDFHRYPGVGHWFMEPDRADAYDAAAAELAFGRIVAFLRENLGPLGA
jgi:carboxymethylenebutenolidase